MTFTYSGTFSRGLDALGARTIDRATALSPLSRLDADAEFVKLDGRFEVYQSLPMDFFGRWPSPASRRSTSRC